MAIRTIVTEGDPVLAKVCHPVTKFDDRLAALLDDMHDTLEASGGVGLAAPQIGILRRVVLVHDLVDANEVMELINPEILETSGEQEGWEGCLSVPGYSGLVVRPDRVKIKAQDRNGNWFEAEGTELTARCFCHELDHLDGHLYTELCDEIYKNEDLEAMDEEEGEDEE